MTNSQKLEIRASTICQRLNAIAGMDELSDEIRTESDALTTEYSDVETKRRAALLAESAEGDRVETHATPDSEDRERAALRDKATVAGYLTAAMAGRLPSGAEAAFGDACGVEPGQIPIDLWEADRPAVETHADATTPSPTTGTGTTVGRILPYVFDKSVAARSGSSSLGQWHRVRLVAVCVRRMQQLPRAGGDEAVAQPLGCGSDPLPLVVHRVEHRELFEQVLELATAVAVEPFDVAVGAD